MSEPGQPRRAGLRLFFALWPDAGLRDCIAEAAARAVSLVPGQRVPPANLHVTLAFLGQVAEQAVPTLMGIGDRGPWPRVALDLERVDYWPKPKVLVAMPETVPPAGIACVDRLWKSLEPLGFVREVRPWWPHLTLVRQVRRPPPAGLELRLSARPARDPFAWRLALVESVTHPEGARYTPLANWPFLG